MADMHLATASRGNCTPMCHGQCVTGKTIVISGIDKTKGNTRANVAFSPSQGVQPSLTFRQFCPSFVGAWRPTTTEPRQQQSNSWSAGSAAQPANRAFLFEAPVPYKLIPSDLAKAIACIWEEGTCLKRSPSTRSPSFSVHASVRILRGRTLKRGETACMPSHMVPTNQNSRGSNQSSSLCATSQDCFRHAARRRPRARTMRLSPGLRAPLSRLTSRKRA